MSLVELRMLVGNENYEVGEVVSMNSKAAESYVKHGFAEYANKLIEKENQEQKPKEEKEKSEKKKKEGYKEVVKVLHEETTLTDEEIEEKEDIEAKITEYKIQALQQLAQKNLAKSTEHIVKALKLKHHFWVIEESQVRTKEIYVYEEGIYTDRGRSVIEQFCRDVLGDAHTSGYKHQVFTKIEDEKALNIQPDEFLDRAPKHLLPVENGLLNLETKELEEFTPEHIFISKIPVEYDPEAKCPEIKKFYKEILGNTEDFQVIKEMYGYFLLKTYAFEKSFMLLGKGRNGKSKHIELAEHFLGEENVANISLDQIENDQYAVANLFGKFANLAGDIGNKPIRDSSDFKALTGGDIIQANRKHMTHLKFRNHAKLVFSANDIPITYDESDGFFRRWIIIDFPHKFIHPNIYDSMDEKQRAKHKRADVNIINKITTPEELSGLLNLAIDGYTSLMDKKGFSNTQMIDTIRDEWRRKSNSFFAFMSDHIKFDRDSKIVKKDLRHNYIEYCRHHEVNSVSDKVIKITLDKQGVSESRDRLDHGTPSEKKYGERPTCWDGIAFKQGVTIDFQSGISIFKGEFEEKRSWSRVGQTVKGVSNSAREDKSITLRANTPVSVSYPCPFIYEGEKTLKIFTKIFCINDQKTPKKDALSDLKTDFTEELQKPQNYLQKIIKPNLIREAIIEGFSADRKPLSFEEIEMLSVRKHQQEIEGWQRGDDFDNKFEQTLKNLARLGDITEIKPGYYQPL